MTSLILSADGPIVGVTDAGFAVGNTSAGVPYSYDGMLSFYPSLGSAVGAVQYQGRQYSVNSGSIDVVRYNTTYDSPGSGVPEPGTFGLLLCASLVGGVARALRRRAR